MTNRPPRTIASIHSAARQVSSRAKRMVGSRDTKWRDRARHQSTHRRSADLIGSSMYLQLPVMYPNGPGLRTIARWIARGGTAARQDRAAFRNPTDTYVAPPCSPAAAHEDHSPDYHHWNHNSDPWRKALPDAVTLTQHFVAKGYTALRSGKIFHGAFPGCDPISCHVASTR